MKEKICKKLKEFATKPVRRIDWSGERWFVRRYKQVLALAWIVYFLLREELVKEILRPVSNYLMNFSCIQWFYVNRLTVLLVFTALLFLAKSIFSILRWCEVIRYFPLGKKKYPEYDFPFQEKLVSFLNRKEERGRNIFWLDGSWGSGKTHFIRTFFENQLYKPREIYYISCFGIRTREQAEKALIEEIEQRSTFGSLDHVPVVSSLVKWSYKILGLDLMKKYSLIIFDDLERVAYSEKQKDKPEDFNDLLGFIDYLANHRNQKVLVLMNKEDMENTYHQIVEEKFKPVVTNIPSQKDIIKNMTEEYDDMSREFIRNIYLFQHEFGFINLRAIPFMYSVFESVRQNGVYSVEWFVTTLNNQMREYMTSIMREVRGEVGEEEVIYIDEYLNDNAYWKGYLDELNKEDYLNMENKLDIYGEILKQLDKEFNSEKNLIIIKYRDSVYEFAIDNDTLRLIESTYS
ncbi:P-loop NTPase fold protein [Streptococcus suis]|uniref:P-loop NTPase fold protein n=1 Tax=Streptococcus suis TaxID=1307 RepID=UPI0004255671|nr:P-loop NTPase fold protein [Streptococcus suis]